MTLGKKRDSSPKRGGADPSPQIVLFLFSAIKRFEIIEDKYSQRRKTLN
jgi:hypothetical protein